MEQTTMSDVKTKTERDTAMPDADRAETAKAEAGQTRQLDSADIALIMKLLPHRYPFLLLDRIRDIDRDESCVGIKNVTINEPFFQGHFPRYPVMPGVLIIEALAQTAGALCIHHSGHTDIPQIVYFMGIDKAKFRKPVVPGDQLHLHLKKIRSRGPVWRFYGVAKVEGQVVAEAEISAMIVDPANVKM
jgi:3-hydroxyacyl-[acyl-carrier-protein] dehydratase